MKRCFLKQFALVLAVALLGTGCASTIGKVPDEPRIGVQLWSVRDEVKKDFDGTLTKLAGLGFQGVEFWGYMGKYGENPAGLRAFLDKSALRCISAHVYLSELVPASFDKTTAFYKTLGCTDLIIGWDQRAYTMEGSPVVAAELSALSGRLAAVGMRIGYHNHDKEMVGAEGQTPWDVLAKGTPHNVILQQDVGWTSFAGKDPVAILKRYPGRSVSMHYKAKFAQGTSGIPLIGQDRTDWAALTAAAKSVGGTQWLIVELDDPPNRMGQVEAVAASLRGLRSALATGASK